ncbi:MAG: hypothetical protein A2289_04960 [Deltaproteobacteria bacterium RIFOXYA12_FULL_58_15]|nr:MAG: hypothetical protein A2289_04960 [Deltaproteobacteria bacterium RIFOXYA12_FULL_58_15]OGR12807.1 MAG: hypothetical protein A2341_24600 [Deltaproteobacteria bacterium RIFOXYB12_FULL_58_9]
MTPAQARERLERVVGKVAGVLRGNEEVVRLLIAAIIARGHVLIEDVPGVGKTTLARAAAKVLGCSFARVQFTADMLPADVLGVHVLHDGDFVFKKGPIFAQLVLADEVNRASPKTQSAMLEAMSERQVTVDDQTFVLDDIFTVLATQNPVEHHGAYPLPESQLDRFMVRLTIGYPPPHEEKALLTEPVGKSPARILDELQPVLGPRQVMAIADLAAKVEIADPVAEYLLALVRATREHTDILMGCSPRGSMALAALCRAWAFLAGRSYVLPDDVKQLAPTVLVHRIVATGGAAAGTRTRALTVIEEIIAQVPAPR